MTYLFGYSGNRYTVEQLETFDTWNKVHPEVRRRVLAMVDGAAKAGYDLGIGSGWRSDKTQLALFLSRYYVVSCEVGYDVRYDGKCWRKKAGVAPAAPPGRSYHESSDPMGYALAVDMLNVQPAIDWANAMDGFYWLKDFEAVNGEQWHYQPIEIPNSRRLYDGNVHTLGRWAPPKQCTVARTLKKGDTGTEVRCLQSTLKNHPQHPQPSLAVDGSFGSQTETAVKNYQNVKGLTVDGIAGPITLGSLGIWAGK